MPKILLVEDNNEFREVVKNYLKQQNMGFKILEADSGETGISLALKEHPDVVLMDIRLPGITGLDAATRLKSHIPETKIIILTMFETEAFRSVFKSEDISAYLGKSELYDKLVPTLKKVLEGSGSTGKSA